MGSFANTVFSILLGWLQGLVSLIWSALTSENGSSVLNFIEKNWIAIAVILCTVGVIADFAVYMFRWQPYKVWRSFWRRVKGIQPETEPVPRQQEEPEGIYFRPSRPSPSQTYKKKNEIPLQEEKPEEDDLLRWREPEEPEDEAEEYPRIVTKAGYVVPKDSPYRRPQERNRRRRIRLLGEDDEKEFHYFSPRPMMDHKEAYNAPVYPEKWTGSREQDS